MMKKSPILWAVLLSIFLSGCGGDSTSTKQNTPEAQNASETQSTATKDEQRKTANKEVIDELGTFVKKVDEVEKSEWYTPWHDGYPAETAIYWYVGLTPQDYVNQRIKLVHFSSGTNWVFWDNVTFSTAEKNWKHEIGSFAGQSGNGKSTQIVMGGKYETLDVPFEKLLEGIKLVTSGTNPIIRLSGKQYVHDIRLTDTDIQNLKRALIFYENSKIINGRITREQ